LRDEKLSGKKAYSANNKPEGLARLASASGDLGPKVEGLFGSVVPNAADDSPKSG
jgi:hypothetical protein